MVTPPPASPMEAIELIGNLRQHIRADHAALQRAWWLAGEWTAQADNFAPYSATARTLRSCAAELVTAITQEHHDDS